MDKLQHPRNGVKASGLTISDATVNAAGQTTPALTEITLPHKTRRYKPRARKCKRRGCNVVFTPQTKHGKYCSDNCRKRAHWKRMRRNNPPVKPEPILEIRLCDHCGNTFLARKGSTARYCSGSHKSAAYKHRKRATVRAMMGDLNMTKNEAADALDIHGMAQAQRYLVAQGYRYDSFRRGWVIEGIKEDVKVPA